MGKACCETVLKPFRLCPVHGRIGPAALKLSLRRFPAGFRCASLPAYFFGLCNSLLAILIGVAASMFLCIAIARAIFFRQFAACKSYWGGSARVADHESCDDSSPFWRCLKFLPTKTSKSKTFGSGAELQFWSRFWSREEKS